VADSVCATESLFVTLMVEPGATEALMGENMKFEMVMALVEVAPADVEPEPAPLEGADPDGVGPPLLHAARSSAPPRTRASAPPLNRRVGSRMAQTAWDVGLNASGVPEEVCAPGYIPST
jgi:hypothetical protein